MTSKLRWVIIVAITVCIAACSSFNLANANQFRKGMTQENVLDLASKGPKRTFELSIPSEPTAKISVMEFEMTLGSITADYWAVFENDKLLYWGHPYEFNRHPDEKLNEIGRVANSK